MKNKITILLGIVTMLLTINFNASAQLSEEVVKRTPELPGELMIDFGFNLLTNKPSHWDQTHWFRSKSFAVYFVHPLDVTEKLEVRPAIGMSFDKIGSKNANFYAIDPDNPVVLIPENADVIKAQVAISNIEIPIEIRYNFSGNSDRTSPFIGLGPVAAFTYETKLKVKYEDGGEKYKVKSKGDADFLDTPKFRLGAHARLGWGQFAFFYKYYFNPVFKDSGFDGTGETMMSTVGISITGL
ncbi:outer membrane beta-barrel protein [Reichenbachiella ulvae]|uniref:Outer membrane beta-barrel protein n=1 Tax=Reichenbachiella ulvae TaxID=2980104 RepID=A0ABT3CYA1_9BACT|nr:outer membrane beta-barrel protein [Reichenbachiella ulvae]MCV9388622.1 outer membrane beta-barrel protein [Reichenbachiella ulvae]